MKKGMEENGQRTDPGTDGRQEQEDAVLRGQLQQALDSVEPDREARERMLARQLCPFSQRHQTDL